MAKAAVMGVALALAWSWFGVSEGPSMLPAIPQRAWQIAIPTLSGHLFLARGQIVRAAVPAAGLRVTKRLVAMGGDLVEVRRDRPFRVPDGYVFLLGDNARNSFDSRAFGPVPQESVYAVVIATGPLDGRAFALFRGLATSTAR